MTRIVGPPRGPAADGGNDRPPSCRLRVREDAPMPDLELAAQTVEQARAVIDAAARHLAEGAGARPDPSRTPENQAVVYDLAHAAAGVEIAQSVIGYGRKGDVE